MRDEVQIQHAADENALTFGQLLALFFLLLPIFAGVEAYCGTYTEASTVFTVIANTHSDQMPKEAASEPKFQARHALQIQRRAKPTELWSTIRPLSRTVRQVSQAMNCHPLPGLGHKQRVRIISTISIKLRYQATRILVFRLLIHLMDRVLQREKAEQEFSTTSSLLCWKNSRSPSVGGPAGAARVTLPTTILTLLLQLRSCLPDFSCIR